MLALDAFAALCFLSPLPPLALVYPQRVRPPTHTWKSVQLELLTSSRYTSSAGDVMFAPDDKISAQKHTNAL